MLAGHVNSQEEGTSTFLRTQARLSCGKLEDGRVRGKVLGSMSEERNVQKPDFIMFRSQLSRSDFSDFVQLMRSCSCHH